jgi:hypothetical protein
MKYKIQYNVILGWSDLIYSEDSRKTYKYDVFETLYDAKIWLNTYLLKENQMEDFENYRIVEENTKQDFDLTKIPTEEWMKMLFSKVQFA